MMMTEYQKEMIADLWMRGFTTYEIAEKLGLTKNSICGALFRMRTKDKNIHVRSKKSKIFSDMSLEEQRKRPKKARRKKSKKALEKEFIAKQPIIAIDRKTCFTIPVHTDFKPISLVELRPVGVKSGTCHWPIDTPKAVLYCGVPTDGACPYCASHAALAYSKHAANEGKTA